MPCPENIIPPKKGEIRNPKGKAKGTPNRSTIAKEVLKMMVEPPEQILGNLKRMYPSFFKNKSDRWTNEYIAYLRMMQKAVIKGDTRAFELLLDSAYGKAKETHELDSNLDLGEIVIKIVNGDKKSGNTSN